MTVSAENVISVITIANVQIIGVCDDTNKDSLIIKFPRIMKMKDKNFKELMLVKIIVYGAKPVTTLSEAVVHKNSIISLHKPIEIIKQEYIKSLVTDGDIQQREA